MVALVGGVGLFGFFGFFGALFVVFLVFVMVSVLVESFEMLSIKVLSGRTCDGLSVPQPRVRSSTAKVNSKMARTISPSLSGSIM